MDVKYSPLELGKKGEKIAAQFLQSCGYKIIECNARNCFGEIDIIAQEGKTICFIEVKTRRSSRCGAPAESVTARKRTQIARSALAYLKSHNLLSNPARFDVVQVTDAVSVIRNAFESPILF